MSWTLAPNLAQIEAIAKHCYPGLVVYAIGDQAHQAEQSDHNPDSRGVVHAIDLMFEDDVRYNHGAPVTLTWLLTLGVRDSLQYVIHDRGIWSRSWGWTRHDYDGTDPHTNHIHVSGKHGTVGKNAATGTGYDLEAEKMIPVGSPCITSQPPAPVVEDQIMDVILPAGYNGADGKKTITAEAALSSIMRYVLEARNDAIAAARAADPDALAAAIVAKLPTGSPDVTAIKTALAEVLNDATVDVSVPAAG